MPRGNKTSPVRCPDCKRRVPQRQLIGQLDGQRCQACAKKRGSKGDA